MSRPRCRLEGNSGKIYSLPKIFIKWRDIFSWQVLFQSQNLEEADFTRAILLTRLYLSAKI